MRNKALEEGFRWEEGRFVFEALLNAFRDSSFTAFGMTGGRDNM